MAFFIKSAFCLFLFYGLYRLWFRNETWFQLQRMYLIASLALSVLLACADLSMLTSYTQASTNLPIYSLANFEFADGQLSQPIHEKSTYSWSELTWYIYLIGATISATRYFAGIINLYKIRIAYGMTFYKGSRVVLTGDDMRTFSFGKTIYMNRGDFESPGSDEIFIHEKAHIRQHHSADLLFAELLLVFLWFNPLVNLFIRSLKQVHEYLADEAVLQSGFTVVSYGTLLLNQLNCPPPFLASSFSSHIKKRIQMITKIKSSKSSQWKLFIAIPAIAGLIFTFACSEKNGLMHDDETLSAAQNSSAFSEKTSIPSRCPIQGGYSISSHWGTRIHPIYKTEKHHSGCDFKAAKGTPVVATADGTVSELPESFTDGKGYGRFIVVDHGNGVRTRYAQLSGYKVEMGQVVSSGDIIGYVGMSGLATGAHLHYEVWNGEENLNPEDYFIQ